MPKRVSAAVKTKGKVKKTLVVADEDEIRRRAYELYLERGGTTGDPGQDWLQAEHEILARRKGRKAGK